MKYKKGVSMQTILLILAAFFLVIILAITWPIISTTSRSTKSTAVQQKLDACRVNTEKAIADGNPLADYDEDELADSCDNCPKTPNSGNYTQDLDGDLFPALKPNAPTKYIICCAQGVDEAKIKGNVKKYCETLKNDEPGKFVPWILITNYLKPPKPKD